MNITLTSEEILLIQEKRAEEKRMEEELRKSFDHYKENRIKSETNRLERNQQDAEKLKQTYESMFANLVKVSKDYSLDTKRIDYVVEISLYDIDDNGYEIRSGEPREVVKLNSYHYKHVIKYTGKVPEGHSYHVALHEKYSRYSGRANGYKMQVQGTGISTWDKRGQMTNPKSVHQRLIEHVESAFNQIEYRSQRELSTKRIADKFKLEFSEFNNKVEFDGRNEFVVTLDNNISVVFYGHEDGNGNITFNNPKINLPYNKFEIKGLLEVLNLVKGGE
jgi:hypothetical protein